MPVTLFVSIIAYSICLKQRQTIEPLVVAGSDAKINDFPFSAYLKIKCTTVDVDTQNFMCGSSIINHILTLTAAHCLDGCSTDTKILISVGHEVKLKGAVSSAHSFVNNKKYSLRKLTHDIALVRLKTPLEFSLNISRVALMKNPPYSEVAFVAGWGLIDVANRKFPELLQYTKQYVKSKQECGMLLNEKHTKDGTFCASTENAYPARGDSGSALVVRDYIQIGLVSYKLKNPTSKNKNVVVYTDTGYFFNWIQKHSERLSCA